MFDFLQEVNLLEDLSLREIVLHVVLFDGFDSNLLSCKLVDSKCHFSEGTFTDHFDEFVEIESCGWKFVVLLDVLLHVLNQLISLLKNSVINSSCWFLIPLATSFSRVYAVFLGTAGLVGWVGGIAGAAASLV